MKHALIWGAGGGIGRALAAALAADGWHVLGVARNPAALDGPGVEGYPADLASDGDIAAATLWAAREAGEVALWIYAAGDIAATPLADTTPAEWERIMLANLGGAQAAVRHSLPLVAKGGHMVFIGAFVDRITLPRLGAYAAAKAGLEAYTTVLAKEQRVKRITLVRVGAVDTPFWEKVPFKPPKQGTLPPEQVAAAILEAHKTGHKGALDIVP